MSGVLTFLSWVLFSIAIGISLTTNKKSKNAKTRAGVGIVTLFIFFILIVKVIPPMKAAEAKDTATACLSQHLGIPTVNIDVPVCITTGLFGCGTWKANYTAGSTVGTVEYDDSTCTIERR